LAILVGWWRWRPAHGIMPLAVAIYHSVHLALRRGRIRSDGATTNGYCGSCAAMSDQIDCAGTVLVPQIDH
jgi:hypothetical protein